MEQVALKVIQQNAYSTGRRKKKSEHVYGWKGEKEQAEEKRTKRNREREGEFRIIIAGLGYTFESVVYVFYELTTSHCVENPPCCQGFSAFRMSFLMTFPSEIWSRWSKMLWLQVNTSTSTRVLVWHTRNALENAENGEIGLLYATWHKEGLTLGCA